MARSVDTGWITILLILVMGAVVGVVAIQQGWITAEQVAKYGIWALIGLIAVFMFASRYTRTKWDDIILSYLLLLSIGGIVGTYLIDTGYITQGYMVLGGLFIVFILLLALYSKAGYEKVRGARFQ